MAEKIIGHVAKGHMNQPEGTTLAKPEIIEQNKEMTVADYTQQKKNNYVSSY